MVIEAVVAGLDCSVTPANRTLTTAYYSAGPIARRRLLASLDGLTHPARTAGERRATRRKLARMVLQDVSQQAWVNDVLRQAPPLPRPEGVDRLLRSAELDHIRRNLRRARDDEINSPFHT